MSGLEIFEAIGEIDPELIEKAERYVFKPSKIRRGLFLRRSDYFRFASVAAVVVVIGIGIFPYLRMIFGGFGAAAGDTAGTENEKTADVTGAVETFATTSVPGTPDETVTVEERFPGFFDIYGSTTIAGKGIELETFEASDGDSCRMLTNFADTELTATIFYETEMTLSEMTDGLPILEPVDRTDTVYVETIRMIESDRIRIIGVEYSGSLDRDVKIGNETVQLDDYLYEEFCGRTNLGDLLDRDEILACYEQVIDDFALDDTAPLHSKVLNEPRKVTLDFKVTLKAGESFELRLGQVLKLAYTNTAAIDRNIELLRISKAELDKDIKAVTEQLAELDKDILALLASSEYHGSTELANANAKKDSLNAQLEQCRSKAAAIDAQLENLNAKKQELSAIEASELAKTRAKDAK